MLTFRPSCPGFSRPDPGAPLQGENGPAAGLNHTPALSESLSEKTTLLEAIRRGQGRQGRSGKIDPNNARWKRVREYPQSPWADRRSQAAALPPGQSLRAAPRAAPGARAVSRPGLFRPCPGHPSCMETARRPGTARRPHGDVCMEPAWSPHGDLSSSMESAWRRLWRFGLKADPKGSETV